MAPKRINGSNVGDERWAAVVARRTELAPRFVYAVKTTGVFCRPGCASRLPRRENVVFFDDASAARRGGFRPCKRCRPEATAPVDPHAAAVLRACRTLEAHGPAPLAKLAAAAGYSPPHFQRLFKRIIGVTPKAYAAQQRLRNVREELPGNRSVLTAAQAAGYSTGSRFYADAAPLLGMRPAELRNGARDQTMQAAFVSTDLGLLLVAATSRGVCAIELGNDQRSLLAALRAWFPHAEFRESTPAFRKLVKSAAASIERPRRSWQLPLDVQGTAFQRRVWEALRTIPAGTTTTYAALAASIGKSRAVRAVGTACGANKLAVAVPCHRVLGTDGQLHGYRWGLERKQALLARERRS
jgi:AraC family transcriptional regulator of adaptative response/methylated-DNA-[protein]-cysteine methyltransferase